MQYGGRGRDHGTWDHLQVRVVGQPGPAALIQLYLTDAWWAIQWCQLKFALGWKSPYHVCLGYLALCAEWIFFFNNECL